MPQAKLWEHRSSTTKVQSEKKKKKTFFFDKLQKKRKKTFFFRQTSQDWNFNEIWGNSPHEYIKQILGIQHQCPWGLCE